MSFSELPEDLSVDDVRPATPSPTTAAPKPAEQERPAARDVVSTAPTTTAPAAPAATDTLPAERELRFRDLQLSEQVQRAVERTGYETPTPIQAQIIPHMLAGRDVLTQSQTGTGKTAAFALPILSRIEAGRRPPQVLVLVPTRELALQVAASFGRYASELPELSIATIYGGQSYEPQLRQLHRGAQIVVGTPGRVIDHLNKGTLDISRIDCLVLDEADEMLNMGFLEDVQFVLEKAPAERQIALFSATLPRPIAIIARQYLRDPVKITVQTKTMTADSIRQRALFVAPHEKVHALGRFLESEVTDGVIVFTKTKAATLAVAESLSQTGLSAAALNGDMPQAARERTVEQFKSGRLNILVATDIAARGLDVSRVSHVFNFDPPHDAEAYIHRVGRTGRAGRSGEAIIFLSNSQRAKLRLIENATKHRIEVVQLPSAADINKLRIARFKQQITDVIDGHDLTVYSDLISAYAAETEQPVELIAAALAHLSQQGRPLLIKDRPRRDRDERSKTPQRNRFERDVQRNSNERPRYDATRQARPAAAPRFGKERFRIEVGRRDGVEARHIVGAAANEAGIDGEFIGPISIFDSYSTLDLPEGMPHELLQTLRRTRVVGKLLLMSRIGRSEVSPAVRTNAHGVERHHASGPDLSKPPGKRFGTRPNAVGKAGAAVKAKPLAKKKKKRNPTPS